MSQSTKARMILLMMLLLIVVCSILFSSCSPQRRLANLVENHPELVNRDTIKRSDTILTERILSDTTLIFSGRIDTFTIVKDKLRYQIIRDHDTLRVSAEVKADTIIREVPMYINSINPVKYEKVKWYCYLLYAGIGMVVLIAIYFLKKIFFK